jgi:ubiquinone/menaquinone biosynthesis C-methylase UbiE
MDGTLIFSSKAAMYAKYRWHYAPEAIETILRVTGISNRSTLADIGAGTGILTAAFLGRVGPIYAIEPNPEMRQLAVEVLGSLPACQVVDGRAEATGLADHTVDLITVAQAIHWFQPERARKEFFRILKSAGWLAILHNYGTQEELGKALQRVFPPEFDTEHQMLGRNKPRSYYFGSNHFEKYQFENDQVLGWEAFFGGIATASFAPDPGSSAYEKFQQNVRRVFNEFSTEGAIFMPVTTELFLGQILDDPA